MSSLSGYEVVANGAELARRFEKHDPGAAGIRDASGRRAIAAAKEDSDEDALGASVRAAVEDGHSWSAVAVMLGVSGDAARRRFGRQARSDP